MTASCEAVVQTIDAMLAVFPWRRALDHGRV